jgi:VanZ family protein
VALFLMRRLNRRRTGTLCLVLAAGYLLVGWWPFAPFPHNQVAWLDSRPGLRSKPNAVAYDQDPLPDSDAEKQGQQTAHFTVELWLQAGRERQSDIFHILTVHDGRFPSNLVLCQWKDALLLRSPSPRNPRGFREEGLHVLQQKQTRFLTITSDRSGTAFYVDGVLVKRVPQFALPPESLHGRLILCDAANGKHCWTGSLFGLAILNRALQESEVSARYRLWTNGAVASLQEEVQVSAMYDFHEGTGRWAYDLSTNRHRLSMPPHYRVVQRTFLELPWRAAVSGWADVPDILLNLIGFLPFGFLVFHYCHLAAPGKVWGNLLLALLAGAAVSLLIELVQVWLPTRSSSALDLICNTLGSFAGILIAHRCHRKGDKRWATREPDNPLSTAGQSL